MEKLTAIALELLNKYYHVKKERLDAISDDRQSGQNHVAQARKELNLEFESYARKIREAIS